MRHCGVLFPLMEEGGARGEKSEQCSECSPWVQCPVSSAELDTSPRTSPGVKLMSVCWVSFIFSQMETSRPCCSNPSFKLLPWSVLYRDRHLFALRGKTFKMCLSTGMISGLEKAACTSTPFSSSLLWLDCPVFCSFELGSAVAVLTLPFLFFRQNFFNAY